MAAIFHLVRLSEAVQSRWTRLVCGAVDAALDSSGGVRLLTWGAANEPSREVLVLSARSGTPRAPRVLAIPNALRDQVRINGRPAPLSFHLLADKDEVCVAGSRFFFSVKDPVAVEVYQDDPCVCSRCQDRIARETATEVVRCPDCSRIYHESPVSACWSYGPCQCGRDTATSDPGWNPDEL